MSTKIRNNIIREECTIGMVEAVPIGAKIQVGWPMVFPLVLKTNNCPT